MMILTVIHVSVLRAWQRVARGTLFTFHLNQTASSIAPSCLDQLAVDASDDQDLLTARRHCCVMDEECDAEESSRLSTSQFCLALVLARGQKLAIACGMTLELVCGFSRTYSS